MAAARVVDASALGAIAFGEPRAGEVLEQLEGAELFSPSLLTYEMTGIARKKLDLYPDSSAGIETALDAALNGIGIQLVDISPVHVLGISRARGLTVYDACYLWLAQTLRAPLVTLDDTLDRAYRSR